MNKQNIQMMDMIVYDNMPSCNIPFFFAILTIFKAMLECYISPENYFQGENGKKRKNLHDIGFISISL